MRRFNPRCDLPNIDHAEPVDLEERAYFRAIEPKAVKTPDGLNRIISIENWYWVCLDYMADEWETDLDDVLKMVFHDFGEERESDFEERLPNYIRLTIYVFISRVIDFEDGLANSTVLPLEELYQ